MGQKLADALRLAGFEGLANRAELGEFHELRSPHNMPDVMLYLELWKIISTDQSTARRKAARAIRRRHMQGEFNEQGGHGLAPDRAELPTEEPRVVVDAH